MFNRKPDQAALDKTITDLHSEIAGYTNDDQPEAYSKAVDQLTKLYAIKQETKPDRVSKDTLVTALSGIVGILVIVAYEQKHVMTSKALPHIKFGQR